MQITNNDNNSIQNIGTYVNRKVQWNNNKLLKEVSIYFLKIHSAK